METLTSFPGFEIIITHKNDGDMRKKEQLSNIIRPYPQVHGYEIREYTGKSDETFDYIDGIYTEISNVTIGSLCADCPVVLFMGRGEICAIHSGWKGTRANIVSHALERMMHTPRKDLKVFIGPHISSDSYEVREDFFPNFPLKYIREKEGKSYFDIECTIRDQLLEGGIETTNIFSHGANTFTRGDFFSYRRDGMIGVGLVGITMLP